jgi:hypothetical protein
MKPDLAEKFRMALAEGIMNAVHIVEDQDPSLSFNQIIGLVANEFDDFLYDFDKHMNGVEEIEPDSLTIDEYDAPTRRLSARWTFEDHQETIVGWGPELDEVSLRKMLEDELSKYIDQNAFLDTANASSMKNFEGMLWKDNTRNLLLEGTEAGWMEHKQVPNEIIDINPMSDPVGKIFTMEVDYRSSKKDFEVVYTGPVSVGGTVDTPLVFPDKPRYPTGAPSKF